MKKFTIISGLLLIILGFSACMQTNTETTTTVTDSSFLAGTEDSANFQNYSEDILTKSLKNNRRVVLFFHADWCPTCRTLASDIITNSSDLPDDLTILKLDYDTETALKEEYGVLIQHSLIQLDKNSEEVTRWLGGGVPLILEKLN